MNRPRSLPEGWYPSSESGVRRQCAEWRDQGLGTARRNIAVVIPHAGWYFSGALAYAGISSLVDAPESVVVMGGHLRPGDPVLIARDEGYQTPLGVLPADLGLSERISSVLGAREDRTSDNTVEVHLPLVAERFGLVPTVHLRLPPSDLAIRAGAEIARYAAEHNRRIVVVGSTDLTHYGPGYGFTPKGLGREGVEWVKSSNDARLVASIVGMDPAEVIQRGLHEHSACSPGAAAGAMEFARSLGADRGERIRYSTSYDVRPSDSFVGYVAVGFAA